MTIDITIWVCIPYIVMIAVTTDGVDSKPQTCYCSGGDF